MAEPIADPSIDIAEQATAGAAWTVAATLCSRVVTTVVFIALSRILVPADFGVVALASVAVAILQAIAESGLGRALVRMPVLTPAHIDTAFWMGTAWSSGLALLLAALSVPLGTALGDSAVSPILAVMSIALVLGGLQSVQLGLLSRDMRFREISIREVAGSLTGCVVGVAVALAGGGAWALVAQLLTTQFFSVGTLWVISDWRPSWRFDRSLVPDLWHYGANFMLTSLSGTLQRNVDNLVVGAFLGVVELGYYSVAYRIFLLLTSLTVDATVTIGLPTFSKLQDDPKRLVDAFCRAVDLSCRITFPVFVFLAIEGSTLVSLTSGERWAPAGKILVALCPAGLVLAITTFDGSVLFALGRLKAVAFCTTATVVVTTAAFLIGVQFGTVAVAAGYAASLFVMWPVRVWLIARCAPLSVTSYLRRILRSALICMPLVVALLITRALVPVVSWVGLIVAIVVGLAAYLPVLWFVDRPMVVMLHNTTTSAVGASRA